MRSVFLYMAMTFDGLVAGAVAADSAGDHAATYRGRVQPRRDTRLGRLRTAAREERQDLVTGVAKLKAQPGRDIGVPGGVRTGQTFARLGLVDEYILMVHPIAIGAGRPLFTKRTELELTRKKAYRTGVMQVRFRPRAKS